MAVIPEITLPTGVGYTGHRYGASISNSSFAPGARLVSEYRTNKNQWTFNLGYTYYDQAEFKFPEQHYPRIDGRSRVFLGAGWLIKLSQKWALDSEFSSQLTPGDNHFTPPGLFTVGGRYQPSQSLSWNLGLGTGALGNAGGNDTVVYLGVKIPLMGSLKRNQNNHDSSDSLYEDPLLKDAYKKNLIDNSNDSSRLRRQEIDPYINSNPIDEDTGKPLFTQDELTKKALFND